MNRKELDAAYNNGAAVKDSAQIVAGWTERSEKTRARFSAGLDLRYGPRERNRIDYLEARPGAPLLAYIHGGYWQARSKEIFACLAEGALAHGISVAMIGYTLAPDIRLDGIVAEIRAALDFLSQKTPNFVVSGWSAGGHLAAMSMSHPAVRGGLAISGLYDLEPLRHSYINDKLGMDADEAKRNSPMLLPDSGKPLVVAYGTAELPELQRQSRDYAAHCKGARLAPIEGCNHFTILEELAAPGGRLTAIVRTLV